MVEMLSGNREICGKAGGTSQQLKKPCYLHVANPLS